MQKKSLAVPFGMSLWPNPAGRLSIIDCRTAKFTNYNDRQHQTLSGLSQLSRRSQDFVTRPIARHPYRECCPGQMPPAHPFISFVSHEVVASNPPGNELARSRVWSLCEKHAGYIGIRVICCDKRHVFSACTLPDSNLLLGGREF